MSISFTLVFCSSIEKLSNFHIFSLGWLPSIPIYCFTTVMNNNCSIRSLSQTCPFLVAARRRQGPCPNSLHSHLTLTQKHSCLCLTLTGWQFELCSVQPRRKLTQVMPPQQLCSSSQPLSNTTATVGVNHELGTENLHINIFMYISISAKLLLLIAWIVIESLKWNHKMLQLHYCGTDL